MRQILKFVATLVECLPELPADVMQSWIENPKVLRKVLLETLCSPTVAPRFRIEPPLDLLICVDRSVRPTYPDWVKQVMRPDLELMGPTEYSLPDGVDQWLHDDQKCGAIDGNPIYSYLLERNAFATCLNLQDGLAIQDKGIAVFRRLFQGKSVFLWGSVVKTLDGRLMVPCLYGNVDKVVVGWSGLQGTFNSADPALRFKK